MKIVAFPYHDWRKGQAESFRTRDGHLLLALAEHPSVEQILVIDRPTSRAERIVRGGEPFVRGSLVAERHERGRQARLTRVGPKTIVLDIADPGLIAPLVSRRGWWFDVFDSELTQLLIAWAVRETLSEEAAVIAWVPTVMSAVAALHPRCFVFDSQDNWITHPTLRAHRAQAVRGYRTVGELASTVFVPSDASREQLSPYMQQIEVLPNGVDADVFRGPKARPFDLPAAPVVGYLGKLGLRLDGPLIREVAQHLPRVHFVFVGPTLQRNAVRPFADLPNVFLVGDRRYEAVPPYLANFDLAWIPHRVGEGETGGDLIKKYEYWAAGRQVVTTAVGGIDAWSDQLHLAGDAQEMAHIIDGLLGGRIAPKATDIPSDRTWTAIADRIARALR